ncbi:MAG: hypothetical protein K1X57_16090 [Gemmataceae bacterium]|nr:hypothetical protein [Gemmataceae bacterium]
MSGQLDPTFGAGGIVTTHIGYASSDTGYDIATDATGNVLVAATVDNGSDTDIAVIRYSSAGALDTTFGIGGIAKFAVKASADDVPFDITVDASNRIMVAGSTGGAFGSNRDGFVARLTSAGALDPTLDGDGILVMDFGSNNDIAVAARVDAVSRLVVAGTTTANDCIVWRMNANGELDNSFDDDGKMAATFATCSDMTLDSTGRIIVGGDAGSSLAVARITDTGILDTTFDTDGKQSFNFGGSSVSGGSVAIDSLDRVIVGGTSLSTNNDFAVARLTTAGALDTTFDTDGLKTIAVGTLSDVARAVTVDSADRILIAGTISATSTTTDIGIVRLKSTGALDTAFSTDGKQTISFTGTDNGNAIALDATGRILVAGDTSASTITLTYDVAVARLTAAAGALDTTFNTDGKLTTELLGLTRAYGQASAIDSQGRIVVAGYAFNGTNDDVAVLRYTSAGMLDPTFGGDGIITFSFGSSDDCAYAVAIDASDRVIVAGQYDNGTTRDAAVARITATGVLDTTFSGDGKLTFAFGSTSDSANAIALDSFGKIVVAGTTGNFGSGDMAIARITTVGALDTTFSGDGKLTIDFGTFHDVATGVAVDSLGRIVASGYQFTNGVGYDFEIARIGSTGVLDTTFDSDGKQTVNFGTHDAIANALALDANDRPIMAGQTGNDVGVVRLTTAGAFDISFDGDGLASFSFGPFSTEQALGVKVDSSGRIVLAGNTDFDSFVARFTGTGALDSSFDYDGKRTLVIGSAESTANALAVDKSNRVVVAGVSQRFSGEGQVAVARFIGDAPASVAQVKVNDGSAQRSRVTNLTVTFDQTVTLPPNPADAFQLKRQNDNSNVALDATLVGDSVTLTFTGGPVEFGSLADGRYTLIVLASKVNGGTFDGDGDGIAGDDYVLASAASPNPPTNIFRLFGDADGNGQVTSSDFLAFRLAFLTTSPAFDSNGNGQVDSGDFLQFRLRFLQSV